MAKYEWGIKDTNYNKGDPDQKLELFGTTYSLSGITSPTKFYADRIVVENGRRRDDDAWENDSSMPDLWEYALQEKTY